MELNIYKNGEVEKTYNSTEFDLDTGTCEDLLSLIDIDKFANKNINNEELAVEIMKVVTKALPTFKPMLKQIFVGLTDEELRRTKIKEVGKVVVASVIFTLKEMLQFDTGKN